MASDSADLIKQTTTATFKQDVIEASKRQPVIVELWSGRSGPTVLGLLLEKAVLATRGRVKVARVDVDKEPTLVGSLAPRLVPACSRMSMANEPEAS
jgi:putative thioredoxin